jgi:hypothetical protein
VKIIIFGFNYQPKQLIMRNLLLALAIVAVCFTGKSQETTFGILGGANFASIGGDDIEDVDGRTSFHLGALAEIGITEKFAVQPEVLYSAQGITEGDETLRLDYINIPVFAKYYLIEGLSLEAGPQLGINVNSQYEYDGETEDADGFNTLDLAAALGVGYKLPMGVFFQANYNLGISDVMEEVNGFQVDAKNNVFQFSVGYMF